MKGMIVAAWKTGWALYNLVRFEAGPQALPASAAFLVGSLGLYGLSEFGLAAIGHATGVSLFAGIAAVILLAGLTTIALWLSGRANRVPQTLAALAAAGVVVDASRFGLQLLLRAAVPMVNLASFLLFPLLVWHFLICAHVYREALSQRVVHALGLSLAYVLGLVALRMSLDAAA
jgi:hypothetical protein